MTSQNKIRLAFISILAAGILLFIFLIVPIYNNIKIGAQEIIEQKQKLGSLESRIKNVEEFREGHDEIKGNLAKAETFLINSEAPVDFIRFLEQISQSYQVRIEIAPSATAQEKEDPWPYIRFQITAYSAFPNFLRFLEKIESSPYLIQVFNFNSIRLTEQELLREEAEGLSVGDIRGTLLLRVYAE